MLVLLSDWLPGCGGTALATGSHRWVHSKLAAAEKDGGLTHTEINQQCVDHMLRLARSGRIWIPLDEKTSASSYVTAIKAAETTAVTSIGDTESQKPMNDPRWPGATADDGDGYALHQVCGRAGDVVLLHPWLIHGGTMNMSQRPRLMANGMARIKQQYFDADGGARVLREAA